MSDSSSRRRSALHLHGQPLEVVQESSADDAEWTVEGLCYDMSFSIL